MVCSFFRALYEKVTHDELVTAVKVEQAQNDTADTEDCAKQSTQVSHEVKTPVNLPIVVSLVERHLQRDYVLESVLVRYLTVGLAIQLPARLTFLRKSTNIEVLVVQHEFRALNLVDVVHTTFNADRKPLYAGDCADSLI